MGVLIATPAVVGASAAVAGRQVSYALTGTLKIATLAQGTIVLPPGSTFTATPDPTTGVFTDGKFTVPPIGNIVDSGGVTFITSPGDATGRVDPVSGVAVITVQMKIVVVYDLSGHCTYGPFPLALSSLKAGGSNFGPPQTGRATLTQQGYEVPAGIVSDVSDLTGGKPCGDAPASTTETSASFTLAVSGGAPTTTQPTTTTIATTPLPVAATPALTG
jgi:hypothetical protein